MTLRADWMVNLLHRGCLEGQVSTPRSPLTESNLEIVWHNLEIVWHNLVFELRQEVVDLHFRMQTTDAKVASFLQIIASMHAALFLDPVDINEEESQHRGPSRVDMNQEAREEGTDEAADGKEADKRWGDEPAYIEEEP